VVLLAAAAAAWEIFEGTGDVERRSSSCSDLGLLWEGVFGSVTGDRESRGGSGGAGESENLQS
jgi:hypothetical protein